MWRQIFYYLVKQQSEGLNCVKFIAECYGRNFYHVETLSRRLSWKYLNFWIFISQVVNSQILGYPDVKLSTGMWTVLKGLQTVMSRSSGLMREGFKKKQIFEISLSDVQVYFGWIVRKQYFCLICYCLGSETDNFENVHICTSQFIENQCILEIKMLFQKHYYILLCLKFSFMDMK